jgi:hypothetical protein
MPADLTHSPSLGASTADPARLCTGDTLHVVPSHHVHKAAISATLVTELKASWAQDPVVWYGLPPHVCPQVICSRIIVKCSIYCKMLLVYPARMFIWSVLLFDMSVDQCEVHVADASKFTHMLV